MAGERERGPKGELFELLSELGPLKLTAMTRMEWGPERSLVDAVLFGVAEGLRIGEAAKAAGVSVQQAVAWVKKADEPEITAKTRRSY